MRPTGLLHLGHYVGALESWLKLQREFECYFLIADYQAFADHGRDTQLIRQSVWDVTLDWLAVGLDPNISAFVIQSYVPEHAELTMYLSMLTPLGDLQRNPTLKVEMAQLESARKPLTVGFFNYPVSQVADILLPKANLVPVGEDQLPHVELTREVAKRFNQTYQPVFPEPEALTGRVARLIGTDGQAKMGKTSDNAIYLSDDTETIRAKVRRMITDITGQHPRLQSTDPGVAAFNPVFTYLDAFDRDTEAVADLKTQYQIGKVSDKEIKARLIHVLDAFLDPIRDRRAYYAGRPDEVRDILISGSYRERAIAKATLQEVKVSMGMSYT
jgi:tryptophanyl-tRNA synthetase